MVRNQGKYLRKPSDRKNCREKTKEAFIERL